MTEQADKKITHDELKAWLIAFIPEPAALKIVEGHPNLIVVHHIAKSYNTEKQLCATLNLFLYGIIVGNRVFLGSAWTASQAHFDAPTFFFDVSDDLNDPKVRDIYTSHIIARLMEVSANVNGMISGLVQQITGCKFYISGVLSDSDANVSVPDPLKEVAKP